MDHGGSDYFQYSDNNMHFEDYSEMLNSPCIFNKNGSNDLNQKVNTPPIQNKISCKIDHHDYPVSYPNPCPHNVPQTIEKLQTIYPCLEQNSSMRSIKPIGFSNSISDDSYSLDIYLL